MSFNGVTLADLNGFMKNYTTGRIVPTEFFWNSLDDILKNSVQTDNFRGDLAEILMQTEYPYTGQAFGEDIDIPYPDDLKFIRQYIPLKQIIVNAGLTQQALDRATGGDASWGKVVDAVLRSQRQEFKWLREIIRAGDGTGRLARANGTASHSGTDLTIQCDNTYSDWYCENVALLKVGMAVNIIELDGTTLPDNTGATSFRVKSVTFGNRNNGAATYGTVVLSGVANDISSSVVDGCIIALANTASLSLADSAGAYSGVTTCYQVNDYAAGNGTGHLATALPMGLAGILQTYVSGKAYAESAGTNPLNMTMDTFQGLARDATHPTLSANIWNGGDFGGTAGTPSDWDLSVISDAINQNESNTGGKTDLLIVSSELAMAIHRRNRTESNITVNVSSTSNENQNAVGAQFANKFLCPDGRVIPVQVSKTVPRNCLYGLCTEDLRWYVKGSFDFLKLNGQIWDKSYADRKANFEAPFGGYEQLGAERCDRQFVIQDMKDNI